MNLLLDHLWQSTAVLAVIGLLTLCFRDNGAAVRHALWLAASLKFLLPFAALNWLGYQLSGIFAQPLPAEVVRAVYGASQPFSDGPVFIAMPAPGASLWLPVLAVWGAGSAAVIAVWTVRWLKLRAVLHAAHDAAIAAPMAVKLSSTLLEPGLVGIVRPVLLLPQGITEKLSPAELQAIIVHEACHLRRRDNLTAALHMLVEVVFWFWPPVWWLGARLVAEREKACDEAVLAAGSDPQTYAASILKICRHYIQSPLPCAAGVSGADLKQRMEDIMKNAIIARLGMPKKLLLTAFAAVLLAAPVAMGVLPVPAALAQAACALEPVQQTRTLPPYPAEAARNNLTGTVLVQVNIARDGHVTAASVAQSSGVASLDESAVSHVRQNYRWRPLACASAQTNVRVVFELAAPASGVRPIGFDGADAGLVIRTVDAEAGRAGADPVRVREGGAERTVWLRREGRIAGNILTQASAGTDPRSGQAVVHFRFTPQAQRLFADMTAASVGQRIAILVDGSVISTPRVNEPIAGGEAQASGDFNMEQAKDLAARMLAANAAR